MRNNLKDFKARALARPGVQPAYEGLAEEFELLDQILSARAASGLTQAEVAARIGTTQSAVARLESDIGKHSPSITTLKRYASALGYKLQLRFVKMEAQPARPLQASVKLGTNRRRSLTK